MEWLVVVVTFAITTYIVGKPLYDEDPIEIYSNQQRDLLRSIGISV